MSVDTDSFTPTHEQEAIRDCEATDILVAAGAGTGKTTTTRLRFVRLLEAEIEQGTPPEEALGQILVFTFTDKAAGELEEGIREDTAALLNPKSPEAATMSSAWVGTFHSICARILRSFPLEAGVDPGFEVIDQVDATALKSRAFAEALAGLLDAETGDTEQAKLERLISGLGLDRLGDEIRDAYDELRSRGIAEPSLPADDLPTTYPTELVDEILALAKEIAFDPDRANNAPKKKAQRLVEHLGENGERLTLELAEASQSKSETDETVNRLADRLERAAGKLVAMADGDSTYRMTSRLLQLYGAAYTRLKELDSLLDFEDLQIRTRDLLQNDRRVGDYYRGRFREIMVDEFQDTNGLQLDLIKALRGPDTTLMTVGDELQSIYRFRHANVQIFRDRGRGLPGDGLLEMKGNNRSDQTILDAVNGLGLELDREVWTRRSGNPASRHTFAELEQGERSERGPGADRSVRLLLVERGDWGPLELGAIAPARRPESPDVGDGESGEEKGGPVEHQAAEALAVAQEIRDLVEQGTPQKDVVILLRAMTRAHLYEQALRQVGLTPYTISGRGFWGSATAQTVVALLRVVANPFDEGSLLTALLSPACGLAADAPPILRREVGRDGWLWEAVLDVASGKGVEGGWLGQIDPEDRVRLTRFSDAIEEARGRATDLPLDELVEELVTLTGYDLGALDRDPTSMSDVKRVASIARHYEEEHSRDLRGFLDWVDASQAEDSEAQVATEDERSEVVRIMTVHAAKGAQFEAVFVPDLGRSFKGDRRSLLLLGPSEDPAEPESFAVGLKVGDQRAYDWKSISDEARAANEDEELRLLHVALTRACGHLVLSGCPQGPKSIGELTSIIDRLCFGLGLRAAPDEDGRWGSEVPAEDLAGLIEVETLPVDEQVAERLSRDRPPPDEGDEEDSVAFPPLVRPAPRAYPDIPLSFTALGEFRACPLQFFAKRVLRLSEEGYWPIGGPDTESTGRQGDGASFGTAVHALIEMSARRGWEAPTRERVIAALRAEGIRDSESVGLAEQMVTGLLDSDLIDQLKARGARAEVPIILNVDGVVIRGFIDLLVPGEVPLIVDFKTNRLDEKSPDEFMEGEYGLQRDLYALAVAESPSGEPLADQVRTAFIFLGPTGTVAPVYRDYGPGELGAVRAEVRELVSQIIDPVDLGEDGLSVGCGSCWACQRLGT